MKVIEVILVIKVIRVSIVFGCWSVVIGDWSLVVFQVLGF